jgi:hypothetical protein
MMLILVVYVYGQNILLAIIIDTLTKATRIAEARKLEDPELRSINFVMLVLHLHPLHVK